MIVVTRHGGCSDGKQGATDTIAACMNSALWQDGVNGIKRRHDSQVPVVVERDVAVGSRRVAPRDHEDREPGGYEVAYHRVLWPQVEYVVLHNPRRNEQDWLGADAFCGRTVLDQLHEIVTVDDLAWGDGDVLTDGKPIAQRLGLHRHCVRRILREIKPAPNQIGATFLQGAFKDCWAKPRHVGRRENIQRLSGHEGNPCRIVARHPAQLARRTAPPRLLGKEELLPKDVRRFLPCRIGETRVLLLRLERCVCLFMGDHLQPEVAELCEGTDRFQPKLRLAPRRVGQVSSPVVPGRRLRIGRDALCEAGNSSAPETIYCFEGIPARTIFGRLRSDRWERALVHGMIMLPMARTWRSAEVFCHVFVFLQKIDFHAFEVAARHHAKQSTVLENGQMTETMIAYLAKCVDGFGRACDRDRVGRHCFDEARSLGVFAFSEHSHRVAPGEDAEKPVLFIDH